MLGIHTGRRRWVVQRGARLGDTQAEGDRRVFIDSNSWVSNHAAESHSPLLVSLVYSMFLPDHLPMSRPSTHAWPRFHLHPLESPSFALVYCLCVRLRSLSSTRASLLLRGPSPAPVLFNPSHSPSVDLISTSPHPRFSSLVARKSSARLGTHPFSEGSWCVGHFLRPKYPTPEPVI
jgi:hypothetical protein